MTHADKKYPVILLLIIYLDNKRFLFVESEDKQTFFNKSEFLKIETTKS